MRYVNCGPKMGSTRFKTKKALKDALANSPALIRFDLTALTFDNDLLSCMTPEDIKEGTAMQVTGPCPHTDRRWYATVKLVKGQLKVT